MNSISANVALTVSAALASFAGVNWALPASPQKPLQLILQVDGKNYDVTTDKPFVISVGRKNVDMLLTRKPTDRFDNGGLSFDYPTDMVLSETMNTPELGIWNLEGSDTTLRVQRFASGDLSTLLGVMVDTTVTTFGEDKVQSRSETTYRLLGKKVTAERLSIEMAGTKMRQDFVGLQGKGCAFVLVIQDTSDAKVHGAETEKLLELLRKTLVVSGSR